MAKIAPSILSADFANLERDIHNIEENGSDWVHVDVMDGIFVPNISIGIPVVKALRPVTDLPLDVHLMIDRPVRYVEEFVKAGADYVTIHVPLNDKTRGMINADVISKMKPGAVLLNFSRNELVDNAALLAALESGQLGGYVVDFPSADLLGVEKVVAIPHLGASTEESEDNCAKMAVRQVMDYLENGNIVNSVNFPACDMGVCTKAGRIAIQHRNIPNMLSRFTGAFSAENVNISDLVNRSKGAYAYTMLDLDSPICPKLVEELKKVDGVIRVRVIK